MQIFRNYKVVSLVIRRSLVMEAKEEQISIQNKTINYMKIGNGNRNVLCLPGVLGSLKTDFPNQIQYLNKSQLTLVCMDMPGCGGSRPPNRTFPRNFYHQDAEYAAELMKVLRIPRYSLLGWSDGGISSLILASRYPENVISLVVWGTNASVTAKDLKLYEDVKDIDKWSPKMVEPFLAIYGKELLKKGMTDWVETLEKILMEGGDICKNDVKNIKAPTLIVHGDKDPLVPFEHAEFLKNNIPNSKLVRFPNGKHNLHLRYYKEFNELVEQFFNEN